MRAEALYEHEWIHGLSNTLGARLQRVYGNRYVPMVNPAGERVGSISSTALHVGMRFSYREKIYRTALGAWPFGIASSRSPGFSPTGLS